MANKKIFSIDIEWDKKQVEEALDALEGDVRQAIAGVAVELFNNIINRSPQYSGAYAASWTISSNEPKYINRRGQVEGTALKRDEDTGLFIEAPFQKGSVPAIDLALRESKGFSEAFRLGDTVWIANGVLNEEGESYGPSIESGTINLRAVNRPGDALQRSLNFVVGRYGEISQQAVVKLKMKTL